MKHPTFPEYGKWHVSRSWHGPGILEESCPCPKELCGFVQVDKADPNCTEHPPERAKTIRDSHSPKECSPLMKQSPPPAPF